MMMAKQMGRPEIPALRRGCPIDRENWASARALLSVVVISASSADPVACNGTDRRSAGG
jgi:hypothetical protein